MAKVSCVQNCGPSLCSVCGPNVNTEDLLFSAREANLVYMDKVYSYNQATACPILASVTTDETWTTELTLESIRSNCGCNDGCGCSEGCGCGNSGCGSGCNCGSQRANIICCNCSTANGCTLTSDATFTITRSYVLVQSLNLNTGVLAAGNVTVDGTAVDSLTQTGNRYTATTENLVGTTSRERCKDLGLPSKHFFLISAPGPWHRKWCQSDDKFQLQRNGACAESIDYGDLHRRNLYTGADGFFGSTAAGQCRSSKENAFLS